MNLSPTRLLTMGTNYRIRDRRYTGVLVNKKPTHRAYASSHSLALAAVCFLRTQSVDFQRHVRLESPLCSIACVLAVERKGRLQLGFEVKDGTDAGATAQSVAGRVTSWIAKETGFQFEVLNEPRFVPR